MPDCVIETWELRKQFGSKLAVANLTLAVRRGEVFGFLGPNGAGKTTSIKMLLGLVAPTSGSATVLGVPLGNADVRSKVGFLPEHFRFHDWLTGREFLQFHGKLYRMQPSRLAIRIEALLTRVDLLDAADRKLREYSKGMLQRIGLAQALLNDPHLIFLDEPTSGLDPLGRFLVRDLIQELRQQGTTVFLNSHLLSEVEVTCDRVAFVKKGEIVRELNLKEEARTLDVELKLGVTPKETLEGLTRFGTNLALQNGHVKLQVLNEEVLPEMTRWLVGEGVKVYQIGVKRKSLESVFLEVMGGEERPG
ncbi:MAG TPA: ABC transporter ATP-binding protein [Terriglobia bacterium]|nr:ABC transporter ATP-binding protein [Terriglobia bacterium]